MAPVHENNPIEPNSAEERSTPPAFLDLADSSSRTGTDIAAHLVQQKRLEHERLRQIHRHKFEEQMRLLEQQHAKEESELLNIPGDLRHIAVSAPTTPPRLSNVLGGDVSENNAALDVHTAHLGPIYRAGNVNGVTFASGNHGAVSDKRNSVNFADAERAAPLHAAQGYVGAKSMPASRRGSSDSRDGEDILVQNMQGLGINDVNTAISKPILRQTKTTARFDDHEYPGNYNAGLMLDDELEKDINQTIKFLPNSDEAARNDPYSKLSASSAALDLAPLAQTPPRPTYMSRHMEAQKSSEWPSFSSRPENANRLSRGYSQAAVTLNAPLELGGQLTSASPAPIGQSHSPVPSRRSSPRAFGSEGVIGGRSVPVTPLNTAPLVSSNSGSQGIGSKSGTPALPMGQDQSPIGFNGMAASNFNQRYSGNFEATGGYGLQSIDDRFIDNGYSMSLNGDPRYQSGYGNGYENNSRGGYGQNAGRYGMMGSGRGMGADTKMNGFHGVKHKRGDMDREFNRYASSRLEDLIGEIPLMCKDQHGCRFLQKKLEEGVPEHRDIIFRETFKHFAELMTDPFGNYLCQKLLEYSTDEQRNLICESVAGDLVTISLNMHGTRAVQKMIDFLSTQRQIVAIIRALSLHVVTLIKDLNGNHVIQKCLNRLVPEDNQFIYNAVATHCVEVATHRHGCCVLQRCIDHASETQRLQLVTEITYHALTLVQDPYGNYVVQYILDLNDNRFSDAVIRQFFGNVCALSVQKFSSNVIEKCIRVAEHNTRKLLIEELLNRSRLEKLLRDSFGNYCVQTALDYAEPGQRMLLVEGIRPILPLIRNTPYGKRIQSKLQREQMDVNNVAHYNANYHQAHAALVNLALNNGLGAQGTSRLSHGSPLVSDYQRSPAVYGLSPGLLAGQQGSPLVSHSTHQSPALYSSPGGPVGLDSYGSPAGSLGGQGAGAYQNLGAYNGSVQSVFNSALGSASDPYQTQRGGAYPY
ncbi:related to Drosophila pumilio protein and Mpt5p protein [Serendipita indica DSM 11827]|uniref:Related to Drosophila pumilio protein and Mpt5p protein n=1 Tax=Serendipita indica (strain DSM 11827) TaxID=1109443 RepID=G4T619_SERID|nr:related to Drosophila pumilio protein and Mpt5p protein [Serendipita indica DSM 11827]